MFQQEGPRRFLSMPGSLRRSAQRVQVAIARRAKLAAGRRRDRRAEVVAATGKDVARDIALASPPGAVHDLGAHARRWQDLVLITAEQNHIGLNVFEGDPAGSLSASLSSRRS